MNMRLYSHFLSFQRIPLRIVLSTAVVSVMLGVGMSMMGQPLYIIVLFMLLPWMPVMLFESLWKIDHYHWIAVFAVITVLQLGHVSEHIVQTSVLVLTNTKTTLACPPPVDSDVYAQRAVAAGLRDSQVSPTGLSASVIVAPNANGEITRDASGDMVSGPPACGIFGQLDLEIVHLIWELLGWTLTLVLLTQFPRNRWIWLSLFFATIHTFEHLFISYTFLLDSNAIYEGVRQVWGTVADGRIVTAVPLGREPAMLTFYDVAGKFGLASKNGMLGIFIPALNPYLPTRPFMHLYYNLLVTVPGLIAFVLELRHVYDRYLARALPQLKPAELVAATANLQRRVYKPGEIIVREGEPAQNFYIISEGNVEMICRDSHGQEAVYATRSAGEFFGESGLLQDGQSHMTVRALNPVEVLAMDRQTFEQLMQSSDASRNRLERIARDGFSQGEGEQIKPSMNRPGFEMAQASD